jgi:hypothetical protein
VNTDPVLFHAKSYTVSIYLPVEVTVDPFWKLPLTYGLFKPLSVAHDKYVSENVMVVPHVYMAQLAAHANIGNVLSKMTLELSVVLVTCVHVLPNKSLKLIAKAITHSVSVPLIVYVHDRLVPVPLIAIVCHAIAQVTQVNDSLHVKFNLTIWPIFAKAPLNVLLD